MRAKSFRDIIRLWGSADAMAEELGASAYAARKWLDRDKIPQEWWSALLSAERVRAVGVTAETLVKLAARPRLRAC